MKSCLLLAVFFITTLFVVTANSHPVPFKYPQKPLPDIAQKTVGVVSGGGPAGLLVAKILHDRGEFDYVFISQNKNEYTRENTVSLRPEVFPFFAHMGLDAKLREAAYWAENCHFHYKDSTSWKLIEDIFSEVVEPLDEEFYQQPLTEVFKGDGWPHYAIRIADLEKILSEELVLFRPIYLLEGEFVFTKEEGTEGYSAVFAPSSPDDYPSFTIPQPTLIVIAEGANSRTREALEIDFIRTRKASGEELPKEYWCTGVVSLDGISSTPFPNHISIINENGGELIAYGAFRADKGDLFLNNKVSYEVSNETLARQCMQEGALRLIEKEAEFLRLSVPQNLESISVREASYFTLEIKEASQFTKGKNIILIGDAAHNGTPAGGLGMSLVATVYLQALIDAIESEEEADDILRQYERRVKEIGDFWHFSMAK